ncbi:MAG: hypothetical protein Q7R88_01495 [bacterium]|nr:hypothetical protein [bacterium]
MATRRITAFVEEGILSVHIGNIGTEDPGGRSTVICVTEVEMDAGHALIMDGIVLSNEQHEVESGSITYLLREAILMGMKLQAKASRTAVVKENQLVPLQ